MASVTLVSTNGTRAVLLREAARFCGLVQDMLQDSSDDEGCDAEGEIPVMAVYGSSMQVIVFMCNAMQKAVASGESPPPENLADLRGRYHYHASDAVRDVLKSQPLDELVRCTFTADYLQATTLQELCLFELSLRLSGSSIQSVCASFGLGRKQLGLSASELRALEYDATLTWSS